MTQQIHVGIELECVLNSAINDIIVGEYHEGVTVEDLPGWSSEYDGSLNSKHEFGKHSLCVELVSPLFKSRRALMKGIEDFKNRFSGHGRHELNEVMSFNDSCGAHLHFSIEGFSFSDKVIYEIYPKVRFRFFEKLRESNIKSRHNILEHYNRSYAQILTKEIWRIKSRRAEFNLSSESERKGMEWRSLNLLNVRTWDEFSEFWNIVYDCLEYLCAISQKYENIEEVKIMDEDEIQKTPSVLCQVMSYKRRKRRKTYSNIKISVKDTKEAFL